MTTTSCKLRQLLRVQRLVKQVRADPTDSRARRSLATKVAALTHAYSEFEQTRTWTTDEDEKLIAALVDERQQHERARRLQEWQMRMESDDGIREWVRRTTGPTPPMILKSAIHPQLRARQERDKLAAIWETPPPPAESVDPFLTPTPDTTAYLPRELRVDPTGERLHRRAREQSKKAAGPDAWKPRDIARLPGGWFIARARTWNAVRWEGCCQLVGKEQYETFALTAVW